MPGSPTLNHRGFWYEVHVDRAQSAQDQQSARGVFRIRVEQERTAAAQQHPSPQPTTEQRK